MADYKRMVSYMYQYENGVKRKNVGFVRVEAKGGQCKITLHMQLLGQLDSIFPTYLIQRKQNDLDLIYLGDTVLKNQIMDSRLSADENNIMGSGYGLSDMGGVLLFLNDSVFFATQWDDKPVVASEVLEALRPKTGRHAVSKKQDNTSDMFRNKENAASKEQVGEALEDELKIPTYKLPGGWKMVERLLVPGNKIVEPVQLDDNIEEEIHEEIARLNDFQIDETVQKIVEADFLAGDIDQTEAPLNQEYDTEIDMSEAQQPDYTFQKGDQGANNIYQEQAQRTENTHQEETQRMNSTYQEEAQQLENTFKEEAQLVKNTVQEDIQRMDNTFHKEAQADFVDIPDMDGIRGEDENGSYGIGENANLMDPPTAKNILTNYPKIYPFEDNEIIQCVKIEPKDIGLLPKEIWPLSNNSFLMHGFYCYHHLIFAKMKNRFGCGYILGIPGIFHGREQFMARMFGFESFKSIRRRELRQGDFGYWYIPVYL